MRYQKINLCICTGLIACFFSQIAAPWQSHFLVTYVALQNTPLISKNPTIPAETLSQFLDAESDGLLDFFNSVDKTFDKSENVLPLLPNDLRFNGKSDPQHRPLLQQFTDRLRINPERNYDILFVEYAVGDVHRINNPLEPGNVILPSLLSIEPISSPPFERLNSGELLSPFEIITSAVDEPDFGMDINLWENDKSKTDKNDFRSRYHLGEGPFFSQASTASPVTSQGAFHLGYFNEYFGVNWFRPSLGENTYPEYRIHYFLALSDYAFKHNHPYWGFHFLGWALHYTQDLSQPYHTKVAPGWQIPLHTGVRLAFIPGRVKNNSTNKHFALENYQYYFMVNHIKDSQSPLLTALSYTGWDDDTPYYELYPRQIIARESYNEADKTDDLLESAFSQVINGKFTDDPAKLKFDSNNVNLYSQVSQGDNNVRALNNELVTLFEAVGHHTRKIIGDMYTKNVQNWPTG
jgi:hypothetical protein